MTVPPTPKAPVWPILIPQLEPFDPDNPSDAENPDFQPITFFANAGGTSARAGHVYSGDLFCDPVPDDTSNGMECTEITIDDEDAFAAGNGFIDDDASGVGDGEDIYSDLRGFYDGPAEFQDLPSSIYHTRSFFEPFEAAFDSTTGGFMSTVGPPTYSGYSYVDRAWYGGDGRLGEVTSPADRGTSEAYPEGLPWGQDRGKNDPNLPGGERDGEITAAGPFAWGIHGANGFDAGNVLTLEYLTWRREPPTSKAMKRDFNLDGLLDQGEVRAIGTENYAVDGTTGTIADGGPNVRYPFNRRRLTEDLIEANDWREDFDNQVMSCGGNNFLHSTFLLPEGLIEQGVAAGGRGLFQLPAPSMNLPVQIIEETAGALSPIWFSDFGTSLGDVGESGGATDDFGLRLMVHEWFHVWEGYPDLYDYDDYDGGLVDVPVGLWDPMASSVLAHPAPVLKEKFLGKSLLCTAHEPWINVIDLTDFLEPYEEVEITLTDYAFDPSGSAYLYENPYRPDEFFYFWRVTRDRPSGTINFNRYLPGQGMLIMHADLNDVDVEGQPLQQRQEPYQYFILQADGLNEMGYADDNDRFGDAGDPFPGSTGKTEWLEQGTVPDSKWGDGSFSGLEITDIEEYSNNSVVTFRWKPHLVPELTFINPPGGSILAGNYRIRYTAFDIYGGTQIRFYFDTDNEGYDGTLVPAAPATKLPGSVKPVLQCSRFGTVRRNLLLLCGLDAWSGIGWQDRSALRQCSRPHRQHGTRHPRRSWWAGQRNRRGRNGIQGRELEDSLRRRHHARRRTLVRDRADFG